MFTNVNYKCKYWELRFLYLFQNLRVVMWRVFILLIWKIIDAVCECDLQCTFTGLVIGFM